MLPRRCCGACRRVAAVPRSGSGSGSTNLPAMARRAVPDVEGREDQVGQPAGRPWMRSSACGSSA
eukprot:16308598-Heterocapsa_arctica.AAC.1